MYWEREEKALSSELKIIVVNLALPSTWINILQIVRFCDGKLMLPSLSLNQDSTSILTKKHFIADLIRC